MIRRVLAVIVLAVTAGLYAPPVPVSAAIGGCSTWASGTRTAYSKCTWGDYWESHRVIVLCKQYYTGNLYQTAGPWRSPGSTSGRSCAVGYYRQGYGIQTT